MTTNEAQDYMQQAIALLENKAYHEALVLVDKLDETPKYQGTGILIRQRVAQELLADGQITQAEDMIKELIGMSPYTYEDVHLLIELLIKTNRVTEAMQILKEKQKGFILNPLYIWDWCEVASKLGVPEKALLLLENSKEVFHNEFLMVLYKKQKAKLLNQLVRRKEANELWEELFDLYEDRHAGFMIIAYALSNGNFEKIYQVSCKLLKQQTKDVIYYYCLYLNAVALKQTGSTNAIRAFENALIAYETMNEQQIEKCTILPLKEAVEVELREREKKCYEKY